MNYRNLTPLKKDMSRVLNKSKGLHRSVNVQVYVHVKGFAKCPFSLISAVCFFFPSIFSCLAFFSKGETCQIWQRSPVSGGKTRASVRGSGEGEGFDKWPYRALSWVLWGSSLDCVMCIRIEKTIERTEEAKKTMKFRSKWRRCVYRYYMGQFDPK